MITRPACKRYLISFVFFLTLIGFFPSISFLSLAQPAPDQSLQFADFVEPAFPFITNTLNADSLGPHEPARNLSVRGIILPLGHHTYACFDPDLLRLSVAWHGEFMSLVSMALVSYNEAGNKRNGIPQVLGNPVTGTGIYPGWSIGAPRFEDPRAEGRNPLEVGRGPLPSDQGTWKGIRIENGEAVLEYAVGGVDVEERITGNKPESGMAGFTRHLTVGANSEMMHLVLAEIHKAERVDVEAQQVTVHLGEGNVLSIRLDNPAGRLRLEQGHYLTLALPPARDERRFSLAINRTVGETMVGSPRKTVEGRFWSEPAITEVKKGSEEAAFAIDEITLPLPNRWDRNVRIAAVDFFSDGRGAVSTFEGDVWIIDGIDGDALTWTRFASGLYEPMSIKVVRDTLYTFGREGIIRLVDTDGNGEADWYQNYSDTVVQTGESREFPLSLAVRPEGGFFISKGAALNAGPPTSPAVMPGFRSGGPHSGSVIAVYPGGEKIEVVASGFREPYMSYHRKPGLLTSSDQQGNFVPSTPIYVVQQGGFYGVPATAQQGVQTTPVPPLTWIPHEMDRSSSEQIWIDSQTMGPLNNRLIHLSYGQPGLYRVYMDTTTTPWQGGVALLPGTYPGPIMKGAMNPADGFLYVAGFQVWDSSAPGISALIRYRPTGKKLQIPTSFKVGKQGFLLTFDAPLNPQKATSLEAYRVLRWNYKRTPAYGSAHFTLDGDPGEEPIGIMEPQLSADGKQLFIQVPGLVPVMQMQLDYALAFSDGEPAQGRVAFTVHQLESLELEGFEQRTMPEEVIKVAVVEEDASIERGQELVLRSGCIGCHSQDGATDGYSGPSFKGLYGTQRRLQDGSARMAYERYLRRSIYEPDVEVVRGYDVSMQSYLGILSESEVDSIILFIKSLE